MLSLCSTEVSTSTAALRCQNSRDGHETHHVPDLELEFQCELKEIETTNSQ